MDRQTLEAVAAGLGKPVEELEAVMERNPQLAQLLGRMKPEDAQRLLAALSDKQAAARLLESPAAKELMKKLMGGKS